MPTKTFKSIDEAFQALTDLEIADDKSNFPVARITVPGLHTVNIEMVSEYDYFYVLSPMRVKFINYWLNKLAAQNNEIDTNKLLEKIKNIVSEIDNCRTPEDVNKKAATMSYLFEDEYIRKEFFHNLKQMHIIKWWVGWKRYMQAVKPIGTITIFMYLWLFNFDGLKKNIFLLLSKIGQNMKSQSYTTLTSYGDWDSYKKMLSEADERIRKQLQNSSNN